MDESTSIHRLVLTENPAHVRRFAAHYLEKAADRGSGFYGAYRDVSVTLAPAEGAAKFNKTAKMAVYVGRCTATAQKTGLRGVVIAQGGDDGKMASTAKSCAKKYRLDAKPATLGSDIVSNGAQDFFARAHDTGLNALAILVVDNTGSKACHLTDLRAAFEIAARLAFETLAAL